MPAEVKLSVEDVRKFTAPTDGYLCPLSANRYEIRFNSFKVRDYDKNTTLFEVTAPPYEASEQIIPDDLTAEEEVRRGHIVYDMRVDGLTPPMQTFQMIERHYFRDHLIRSYDFDFGFCIPNSTNTWEAIYDIPALEEEIQRDMIANPYTATSDSFYFVNGDLVMHNKAEYSYYSQ
ncbi:putative UNC119 [Pavlovales sp. CCMP2436]|nr:putative UNC119 [Pavlovales sp. CCMP2436]